MVDRFDSLPRSPEAQFKFASKYVERPVDEKIQHISSWDDIRGWDGGAAHPKPSCWDRVCRQCLSIIVSVDRSVGLFDQVRAKLSAHQSNLSGVGAPSRDQRSCTTWHISPRCSSQVSAGQRVFVTLDEASVASSQPEVLGATTKATNAWFARRVSSSSGMVRL